jgi:hypothetical protein
MTELEELFQRATMALGIAAKEMEWAVSANLATMESSMRAAEQIMATHHVTMAQAFAMPWPIPRSANLRKMDELFSNARPGHSGITGRPRWPGLVRR